MERKKFSKILSAASSFSPCVFLICSWCLYVFLLPSDRKGIMAPCGELKMPESAAEGTRWVSAATGLTSGVRLATWQAAYHWWVYLWLFSFSLRYQKKIIYAEKSGKGVLTSSEILDYFINPFAFRFIGSSFLSWRTLFLSGISCTWGSNNSAGLENSVSSLHSETGTGT